MLKLKLFLFILLLGFAFSFNVKAQEFFDMSEEETSDFINSDGDLEEYEDYVDESELEVINENINERVKYFDIAGAKLGQTFKETKDILKESKYKFIDLEYNIPEYFRFNYDSVCRSKDILVPVNIEACIKGQAKADKMEYISKATFKKHDTNEDIEVFFTSPITENKSWKITYKNDLNKKLGDGKNFQYQREERRRAFWYFVLSKYGEPNIEPNLWVLDAEDENSEGLEASFGALILSNPRQNAFDILESTKEARRDFEYQKYTF